eukprot:scaffold435_cov275-Chaetoceros_neogracile.AAC.10
MKHVTINEPEIHRAWSSITEKRHSGSKHQNNSVLALLSSRIGVSSSTCMHLALLSSEVQVSVCSMYE